MMHAESLVPNGHMDSDPLGSPVSPPFSSSNRMEFPHILTSYPVDPHSWKDITIDFARWCEDIRPGELVTTSSFTLYDAMSAIELMDPKMDIGLLLKDRKIKSFDDGVAKEMVKLDDFSSVELLSVMEKSLPFLILWMQGHCIAQTAFTMLYLHKPEMVKDELMNVYCTTLLELIDCIRQIMADGGVIEEEDFQLMPPIMLSSPDFPSAMSSPKQSRPSSSSVSKALKNAEETCNRHSRRFKAQFKESDTKDDGDESARWNAIGLRFKFLRTLLQLLIGFRLRTDTFFVEAPQQIDILMASLDKISTGCLLEADVIRDAPGFEPLINLHLLPPSFPRHTPLTPNEDTYVFFRRLVEQIRTVLLVRENVSKLEALMEILRRECGLQSLTLTRSMMQTVINHSLSINCAAGTPDSPPSPWFSVPLVESVMESVRAFCHPPLLMPSIPQPPQSADYMRSFFRAAVTVYSNLLRIYGLNKARQRDAIGTALVDMFTLQEDAEKLDDFFHQQFQELRVPGVTHMFCLASWTLLTMLRLMTEYLLSGLELELYAECELHFIYWYLYDVLHHCEIQTILRAENAARENESALAAFQENEARGARKNGKKKVAHKAFLSSSPRPHRSYLARAQTLHHLSGAYQLAILGLQIQGKVAVSEDSLDSEEFRYYHRLMPFLERNAPAFVDYEHYRVVKSVIAQSQSAQTNREQIDALLNGVSEALVNVSDIYRKASQGFQQAERLASTWTDEGQKSRLVKVCRRNDVILKILSAGHQDKRVELVYDVHSWFPSLKLL